MKKCGHTLLFCPHLLSLQTVIVRRCLTYRLGVIVKWGGSIQKLPFLGREFSRVTIFFGAIKVEFTPPLLARLTV